MKTVIITLLCTATLLAGVYGLRQRAWALQLKTQLEETNKDDVKAMETLSDQEKFVLYLRLRSQGEERMADWIKDHYLAPERQGTADNK
jgi:hypothetical protein